MYEPFISKLERGRLNVLIPFEVCKFVLRSLVKTIATISVCKLFSSSFSAHILKKETVAATMYTYSVHQRNDVRLILKCDARNWLERENFYIYQIMARLVMNKTGTSKVGAISKAQKAQSFLNMPRMYS